MEFCRVRDFAVPLLGLSTRHASIHEMRATRLVDSSFRAPHFPDAAETRLCLSKLAKLQCFLTNSLSGRQEQIAGCNLMMVVRFSRPPNP
jgi:hypothetical protein